MPKALFILTMECVASFVYKTTFFSKFYSSLFLFWSKLRFKRYQKYTAWIVQNSFYFKTKILLLHNVKNCDYFDIRKNIFACLFEEGYFLYGQKYCSSIVEEDLFHHDQYCFSSDPTIVLLLILRVGSFHYVQNDVRYIASIILKTVFHSIVKVAVCCHCD